MPNNPLMEALAKLSLVASFIFTIFYTPHIYGFTKPVIVNTVATHYGFNWMDVAELGWMIICPLLVFNVANFLVQSTLMLLNLFIFNKSAPRRY